jgi:hypothetical protein
MTTAIMHFATFCLINAEQISTSLLKVGPVSVADVRVDKIVQEWKGKRLTTTW